MPPIQIAFIGCGRISSKHFDALDSLQDQICVRALCDIDLERAQSAQKRACCAHATSYRDLGAMLQQERSLDAAVIALPNGLHAEAGIQCAEAGLHLIVEKPLAVGLANGKRLVQSCRKHKVQLFLVHQNRFNPPIQQLYEAIATGRLGRIYNLYANVFWTRPQNYYENSWHGTKEMDGGAFYTQASHYVDMIQWLAGGPPKRVWSQLHTLARHIETEDCGTAFFEWEEQITACINMSMLTYPKNLEGSILILGEKGSVKIGGTAMNKVETWQIEDMEFDDQSSYNTESVYGFGHQNMYTAIAATLRSPQRDPALICGEDILDNLYILEGIQKSNGRIIDLERK